MTQEWDSDGWRVARIHTLKVGDWYKAEVRYTTTTAAGTIHNFNHNIWREPTPHFRPTGTTIELDNPGKIIFTWYCTKDDPENRLASALTQASLASPGDATYTPAADAAAAAQSSDGAEETQEPAAAPPPWPRNPSVMRPRTGSRSSSDSDKVSKRMSLPDPPPPIP